MSKEPNEPERALPRPPDGNVRGIPPGFLGALRTVVTRLETEDVVWAVTGSLGQALQGVAVPVHDVDLQTDEAGAHRIGERLSEFTVRPVAFSSAGGIRSHFGEFSVGGVKVEVMGAVQKRLADGSWEPPVEVGPLRVFVEAGEVSVPVLDLAHECRAYEILGRRERADLLRRHLRERDR